MADFMAYYNVTLMNPLVLVGVFLGAMLVFAFCAMTMKAVGRAAHSMVEEVRRQFKEIPACSRVTRVPRLIMLRALRFRPKVPREKCWLPAFSPLSLRSSSVWFSVLAVSSACWSVVLPVVSQSQS
jgi:Na+/H+-translocating membrane pyrophosphatase